MSFYPGQEIYCVDDCGTDGIKSGLTYISGGTFNLCKCGPIVAIVGLQSVYLDGRPFPVGQHGTCNNCKMIRTNQSPFRTYKATRFRPLDEVLEEISIESLIEEEITV